MTECGLLVGAILLILGVAMGFTGYLIEAQIPDLLHRLGTERGPLAAGCSCWR